MYEIAEALAEQASAGRPLVVMNAPFDLTLLDRELRRHRASSLGRWVERTSLHVLDPRVLDNHLDRYRKGRRTLTDLCAHYGVELADAHGRGGRSQAAGGRTGGGAPLPWAAGAPVRRPELHTLQAVWHAGQAQGLQAWFALKRTEEAGGPGLAAAAGPAGDGVAEPPRPQERRARGVGGGAPRRATKPREGDENDALRDMARGQRRSRRRIRRYWVRTGDLFGVDEALSRWS